MIAPSLGDTFFLIATYQPRKDMPYRLLKLQTGETVEPGKTSVNYRGQSYIINDYNEPSHSHPTGAIYLRADTPSLEMKMRPAQLDCMFVYIP